VRWSSRGACTPVLALGCASCALLADLGDATPAGTKTYRDAVVADGAVSYWRLGEPEGDMRAHDAQHLNEGDYSPGVERGVPGGIAGDTAAEFHGSDSVRVDDAPTLDITGAVTLEAWVRPTTLTAGTSQFLVGKYNGTTDGGYWMAILGQSLQLQVRGMKDGTATYDDAIGGQLRGGDWNYVVGSYDDDAGQFVLYNDGEPLPPNSTTKSMGSIGADLYLGFRNGIEIPLTGTLDEVAVYHAALSDAQVANHFRLGTSPAP
jgi:Concanavalin A-like lectin/glucanases superfamily